MDSLGGGVIDEERHLKCQIVVLTRIGLEARRLADGGEI